ncbi:MAG: hypothetical protein ACFFDT_14020 [Candidatus Hodarchaeota archaeon]
MKCQFHDLFQDSFGELEYSPIERLWYSVKKIPLVGNIGMFFLRTSREAKKQSMSKKSKTRNEGRVDLKHQAILNLKKGDVVKVRSREEIEQTLDENNQFERCEFMETMWQYCGGTYKVFKRVEKILDPWTDRLRRCPNIVTLEGLLCHGDPKHAPVCDRTCIYYWKEAWLERISD